MVRLDRHRGFWSWLLLLAVKSWAQTSPTVESAVPLGSVEPVGQVQSEAAADVAMAESAAVAFANITGVPTVAPAAVLPISVPTAAPAEAIPATQYIGAPAGIAAATTLQPPMAAAEAPECKVLAGDLGKTMQVLLFFCSCSALVFKFRRESGDRTSSEFLMDSSKQLIGAGWIHVLNLSFATSFAQQAGDECQWYWLNIMLDCTLGVAVEYVLMLVLTVCAKKMQPAQADDFETGDYRRQGGTCNPVKYFKQLILWLIVVSLMKLGMYVIMSLGNTSLMGVSEVALSPFASDAMLKLFVVMILTPVCMNIFQFWMVDNFIRRHGKESDTSTGDLELDGSMRTRIQHGDM